MEIELILRLAKRIMEKINSLYFKTESNAAFSNNAVIVPVYIDDVKENLPMEFNFYLKNVKGIDVKGDITEDTIDYIAEKIAGIAQNIIQSELNKLD